MPLKSGSSRETMDAAIGAMVDSTSREDGVSRQIGEAEAAKLGRLAWFTIGSGGKIIWWTNVSARSDAASRLDASVRAMCDAVTKTSAADRAEAQRLRERAKKIASQNPAKAAELEIKANTLEGLPD